MASEWLAKLSSTRVGLYLFLLTSILAQELGASGTYTLGTGIGLLFSHGPFNCPSYVLGTADLLFLGLSVARPL